MQVKKCLYCGKEFEDKSDNKSKIYCNNNCGKKYRLLQKNPIIERHCSFCGSKFLPKNRRQKNCSISCKKKNWRKNINPEAEKEISKRARGKRKNNEKLHNIDLEKQRISRVTPRRKYSQIKTTAKERDYVFHISFDNYVEYFWDKPCYYCHDNTVGGIDRIDNNFGYIDGNCVPCCRACNIGKSIYSYDDFINRCKKITQIHSHNTNENKKNTLGVSPLVSGIPR